MSYLLVFVLISLIVLVAFIIGILICSASSQELKSKFEEVAKLINGKVFQSRIPLFGTTKVMGNCEKIPFEITVITGNQYSPPDIRITFLKKPPFLMRISKNSKTARIENKFNLLKNLETGFPDFDKHFLIGTNNCDKCKEFMQHSDIRKIIVNLYAKGWHIIFRKKYIELIKLLKSKHGFIHAANLIDSKEIVEILNEQKSFLTKLF